MKVKEILNNVSKLKENEDKSEKEIADIVLVMDENKKLILRRAIEILQIVVIRSK